MKNGIVKKMACNEGIIISENSKREGGRRKYQASPKKTLEIKRRRRQINRRRDGGGLGIGRLSKVKLSYIRTEIETSGLGYRRASAA